MKPPIQWIGTENFTANRCGPGVPIAIVLHEIDIPLEYADAKACFATAETQGESYHYVIDGCNIHQYVQDDDTAWSFKPGANLAPWSLPTVYPGVDPDCYTINIAISTGVIQAGSGQCERKDNVFPADEIKCLAKLVCELSKLYNIAPDTTHIWRHLTELHDFPFADFLTETINCINAVDEVDPGLVSLCNDIALMPVGAADANTMVVGADCKLYPLNSLDIHVTNSVYNPGDKTLTITLNSGGSFVMDLSDLEEMIPAYVDCNGAAIADGAALATCTDLAAATAAIHPAMIVTFNSGAGNTFNAGAQTLNIDPALEIHVTGTNYNPATKTLTITLSSGSSFNVDLSDLEEMIPAYVDCNGAAIADGAALATCTDLAKSNFSVGADTGAPQSIQPGDTLSIVGGTGIETVVPGVDTIAISVMYSGDAGNVALAGSDGGVFVPSVCAQMAATPIQPDPLLSSQLVWGSDASGGTCGRATIRDVVFAGVRDLKITDCTGGNIDLTASPALATCKDLANAGFNLAADAGTPESVLNGATVTVQGGVGISTGVGGSNTVTVTLAASELTPDVTPTITGIVASTATNPDGALITPASIVCSVVADGKNLVDPALPISVFQSNNGACEAHVIPLADCNIDRYDVMALSPSGEFRKVHDFLNVRSSASSLTIDPAKDSVIQMTASGTVTLAIPGACDRQDFWIINDNPANTVTVTDGGAFVFALSGAGSWLATQGEAAHVVYTSLGWRII